MENKTKTFKYHDELEIDVFENDEKITLVEPAYNNDFIELDKFNENGEVKSEDEISAELDVLASNSDTCLRQKNYIPAIAENTIQKNLEIVDERKNTRFHRFVEGVKNFAQEYKRIIAGAAIGLSFMAVNAPKLSAQTNTMSPSFDEILQQIIDEEMHTVSVSVNGYHFDVYDGDYERQTPDISQVVQSDEIDDEQPAQNLEPDTNTDSSGNGDSPADDSVESTDIENASEEEVVSEQNIDVEDTNALTEDVPEQAETQNNIAEETMQQPEQDASVAETEIITASVAATIQETISQNETHGAEPSSENTVPDDITPDASESDSSESDGKPEREESVPMQSFSADGNTPFMLAGAGLTGLAFGRRKRDREEEKTNFVLEKLSAAGIDVVTSKEEFERILAREEVLQKMTGSLSAEDRKRYFSFDEEDSKKFVEHVQEWQKDNTNPSKLIVVGKVTPVMKILGISERFIEIEQSTLDKILRDEPLYPNDKQGHKLTLDDIYAIPSQLADPVMVFKSRTREDSFVFFTERKDSLNRSILIPMAVDQRRGRIIIHEITSMYGRNNEIDFVKSNIVENNLIYEDRKRSCLWAKEKIEELEELNRKDAEKKISPNGERFTQIQFLGQRFTDNGTYAFNILTKERLVNFISSANQMQEIQKYTQKDVTYGFAYENKIYLNPDVMTSKAAVHEYTHLWDAYTQRTNPELWKKGKALFKNTSYWNEVRQDADYASIAGNDDLILSEIHARICGDIADKVLNRILESDGKLSRDSVADWDKETWAYIASEMGFQEFDNINPEVKLTTADLRTFLSSPMQDLFDNGLEITKNMEKDTQQVQEKNMAENNTKIARTPEEYRLWLESTTDMDSETLRNQEIEERTLTDPWNRTFTAPNYWSYEDIEQWKELMKENNLEIVSSLEVPYHVAKILNGEEELEAINNLEELTLPQRIESIEQLIDMEKQDRKYAWQFSRLSEKDRIEFISSNKSIDDFIDEGIEQIQANDGMSESAIEAEIAAQKNPRPDYLDEQGNPHWFDEEEETEILSDEEIARLKEENQQEDLSQYYERFKKETEGRSEEVQLQKAIALSLDKNVSPLVEVKLNRENWNKIFPDGMIETPIGVVKLGENQFEKLQKSDRNNLLGAMYETLSNPSIVLEKETLDEKTGEFKPVNVFGKSFVYEDTNHKRAVESVIIFKDGENISIGTHNKNIKDFVKQIKTADQVIFADSEISRVASLILQNGGSHVRLQDALATEPFNPNYNKNNLLSIKDLEFSNAEESSKNEQNSSLEKSALEKAADLLKGMNFNSENYKDLLSVINKISEMNGLENLEVPKEEQIQATQASDARQQTTSAEVSDRAADAPGNEIEPFDPKAPVVYGKTMLPAFAVLADGKLQSIENAVVKSHDKGKNTYIVDNGTEIFELPESTFKTLLQDKIEEEQKQSRLAEGKAIVFEDKARGVKGTVIPEWAMYTQNGLETFKDFVPTGFSQAENSYTLSNGNSTMTVTAERFKEITAPERFENHFDEDSPAWKKLCETQYNDFFKPRDNTAYNFRHNLSVYCRKEANSPCDALHLAKEIVQRMPKDEQKKTEKLLKTMAHENESTNELIARIYHESIKEMPLNEDYIKQHQPKNVIARLFYDTISESGKKVEDDPSLIKGTSDRNLKIGDTLKNVDVQMGKLFGGGKDSMHFDELKVVSASKEGNSITLMDSNKSYFKLPRDTVLEHYKEQQLKEMKHDQRHNRSNSMSLAYA